MNDKNAGIFVLLVVGIIIVIMMILSKPQVSWKTTYDYKSDEPYGAKFLYELLTTKYDKTNTVVFDKSLARNEKKIDSTSSYDYIKLGNNRSYDSTELKILLDFVSSGNNAFLSCKNLPSNLLDSLLNSTCNFWRSYTYWYDYGIDDELFEDLSESDSVEVNFEIDDFNNVFDEYTKTEEIEEDYEYESEKEYISYNNFVYDSAVDLTFEKNSSFRKEEAYTFYKFGRYDTTNMNWSYFKDSCLVNSNANFLSYNNCSPVLINIPYGKGQFYIHAIPLVFTNVQLLAENRLEYVEQVMSYLNHDNLIWDDFSGYADSGWSGNSPPQDEKSPLSYLLSEQSFRWAIYLMLAAALLFIVFRAKRKQQYIPVIEPNINTSIDYVEMMGQLYFEAQNHAYIADQIWKKYLDYIKTHYYIIIKEDDESWIKKVAEKSAVSEQKLKGILNAREKTKFKNIGQEELMNLYQKLNNFYTVAK